MRVRGGGGYGHGQPRVGQTGKWRHSEVEVIRTEELGLGCSEGPSLL